MKNIIQVSFKNRLLGIIVRAGFKQAGTKFFTPAGFSQQLAHIERPKGYVIVPHKHNKIERKIMLTKEVLFVKSGKIRIDFYYNKAKYVESRILKSGDIAYLSCGGHGFKFIEKSEVIEVKQGPYFENKDLTKFKSIDENKVKFIK